MAEESSPARGAGGIQQQLDSVEKVLKVALQLRSLYQIGNYHQGEFIRCRQNADEERHRNSVDLQNNFSRMPTVATFANSKTENRFRTRYLFQTIFGRIYLFAEKEKWFLQPTIL